jgi:prepilin signal peptidase PulO-like enzyme (type II secretory pathway)
MTLNWISSRTVSALPLMGIGLALANWNAQPAKAWAWAAAVVVFIVMVVVRRLSQLMLSRSSRDAASARSVASVNGAVVFGALMMIIPLALTLAHVYGVVDDPDSGMRRTTMIMIGAYLAMTGNAMPRMLPPTSSMPCAGARVQAFQRFAGWTWALCGLGFAMTWLALPIAAATPISMSLVAISIIVTIVQLLRLRQPQPHAPRLN